MLFRSDVHEVGESNDDVHEVGESDDDVHEVHKGGNVDAEGGGGEDFDWLEEGFEGPDFDDDIFGNVDDGPSTHDGVSVNVVAPHRPSEGDDGLSTHDGVSINAATLHRPSKGDDGSSTHEDPLVYVAPHRTTAADNDPPLEDDMESLAGSDDD